MAMKKTFERMKLKKRNAAFYPFNYFWTGNGMAQYFKMPDLKLFE